MSALVSALVDPAADDLDAVWVPGALVRCRALTLAEKGALLHLYEAAQTETPAHAQPSPFSALLRTFGPTASSPAEVRSALGALMAKGILRQRTGFLEIEESGFQTPHLIERSA